MIALRHPVHRKVIHSPPVESIGERYYMVINQDGRFQVKA
jgi:hypothetical protein